MLLIHLQNDKQNQRVEHPGGVLELGRGPERPGIPRCYIDDTGVSRDQLQLQECPGGRVAIQNLSQRVTVMLGDQSVLNPGEKREVLLPHQLVVGATLIQLAIKSVAPAG